MSLIIIIAFQKMAHLKLAKEIRIKKEENMVKIWMLKDHSPY
jgi:hypothetical protein